MKLRRPKFLGTALGVVLLAWCLDTIVDRSGPEPALAGPAAEGAPAPAEDRAIGGQVRSTIARLKRGTQQRSPIGPMHRDLFVQTMLMQSLLNPAPVSDAGGGVGGQAEPEQIPFEERHQLRGVLGGRLQLAVIDEAVVSRGAVIDGYRLVEITRDSVTLLRDGQRVQLFVRKD